MSIYVLTKTIYCLDEDGNALDTINSYEILSCYTNKQDAQFECKYLTNELITKEQWYIEYDVIVSELYS